MPLDESTKAKIKELLDKHSPEVRTKIIQLAALNHVIRARKMAEQGAEDGTEENGLTLTGQTHEEVKAAEQVKVAAKKQAEAKAKLAEDAAPS